jgi:hypothetical protein
MEYWMYDLIYVADTMITVVLKLLLVKIAYNFIVKRRWPKWNI